MESVLLILLGWVWLSGSIVLWAFTLEAKTKKIHFLFYPIALLAAPILYVLGMTLGVFRAMKKG